MNIIKYITNRKYRFFLNKIKAVEKSIWEQQFKISKSRQVREGIRQDRDRAVENRGQMENRLKKEEDVKEKENLEEQIKKVSENISNLEHQMKMIDDQISGVVGNETTEGIVGILPTIESLSELKKMYKEHLKSI